MWTGREADLHRIVAEYKLDGRRFGGVVFETLSESIHDHRLAPKRAEVEVAAYILARLGYTEAKLNSLDARGSTLERPDLDVVLSGEPESLGFEVAFGIRSSVAKADAEQLRIETTIRDRLDSDPVFRECFGLGHLSVQLESDRQPLGRAVANKVVRELIAFIASCSHQNGTDDLCFPASCATLCSRGASFSMIRDTGEPYFTAMHGSSIVDRRDSVSTVVNILNSHRKQASNYRRRRNWCAVQITDVSDIFRPTLARIAQLCPPIDPFEKVFVGNPSGRIIVLEERAASVLPEDVPY
jgi:hypothetical protein